MAWRFVTGVNFVRVANIDVSNMQAGTVDLYALMRKAYYQIHGVRTLDNGTVSGGIDGNFGGVARLSTATKTCLRRSTH